MHNVINIARVISSVEHVNSPNKYIVCIFTDSPILKSLMSKLNTIENKVDLLIKDYKTNNPSISSLEEEDFNLVLPLNTLEDINSLEKNLKEDDFYFKFVSNFNNF